MNKRRGAQMPLLEHFREFRSRLVKSTVAVVIGGVFGWVFYQQIVRLLTLPFCELGSARAPIDGQCGDLYVNGILGPFNLQVKIALLSGLLISAPVWLYQFWAFITPALHKREKKTAFLFALMATPLFVGGAFLAYLILPHAVEVLLGFTPDNLENLVRFDEYLDFVIRLLLIFGIAFILPLILVALNLLGIVTGKSILKPWRVAVFSCFVFTAIFTPTPDPITMILLALPLCLLYFLSGIFALLVDRRRKKRTFDLGDIDNPEPI